MATFLSANRSAQKHAMILFTLLYASDVEKHRKNIHESILA